MFRFLYQPLRTSRFVFDLWICQTRNPLQSAHSQLTNAWKMHCGTVTRDSMVAESVLHCWKDPLYQGWGAYLLSQAAWIVHYRWRGTKPIICIQKFCLYLTTVWGRVTSLDLLSKYLVIMEIRFDAMLYSTLTWVTRILVRAISNVHGGRRFPTLVHIKPKTGHA